MTVISITTSHSTALSKDTVSDSWNARNDAISNTYFKMAILLWHCLSMYLRTRYISSLFKKGVSPIFEYKRTLHCEPDFN